MLEKMTRLCNELQIHIEPMPQPVPNINGLALRGKTDGRVILYDDRLSHNHKIQVIAHELAHHVLGHLEESNRKYLDLTNRNPKFEQKIELEADIFATVFSAIVYAGKVAAYE